MVSWRKRSFDELPALSIRGQPLRRSLRLVTFAWMFGVVWMSGVTGAQMTDFCWMLGFSDFDFGVMTAIPFAATFAQLVAAVMIERTGLRKYQFIFFATAHRLLWLVIAALPLLLRPGRATIGVFLATYLASSVLGQMSVPSWQTWMGDLIPRRIRGRYFSIRRVWTIPIQLVVVIVIGFVLDAVTVRPALAPGATALTGAALVQGQPALMWTISAILAVSGIFGAIDTLLFLKMREIVSPPLVAGGREGRQGVAGVLATLTIEPVRVLAGPFRDRLFRHYALYSATVAFAMSVGGNYFWNYVLKNVGYSKLGANIVFQVCGATSAMIMARNWGRLVDVWGRRPVLMIGTIGWVFGPVGWFLCPPGNMPLCYLAGALTSLWSGLMFGAVNLAQISVVMGYSESEGRSKYVAANAMVAAVGGFLGGMVGGKVADLLQFMQQAPWRVGPFLWTNYHVVFFLSAMFRGLSLFWLIGMPDPGAKPFRDVLGEIRVRLPRYAWRCLTWPIRAIRGRGGNDE